MYIKKISTFLYLIMVITSCKYDILKKDYTYKFNYPIIYLYNHDPYGDIMILIKKKFHIHNISYIDCQKYINCKKELKKKENPYLILYINDISKKYIKTALFQDGQSAEYQLTLTIKVKIKTEKDEWYDFNITVFKSFFNNPTTILANSVKKNDICELMYQEVAEKLIEIILYNFPLKKH